MNDIWCMIKQTERQTFIKSLEEKRDNAGLNNASLASLAGLNQTAVRDIIQNQKNMPRYDTLEALAGALRCTVKELVTGEPDTDTVIPTGHISVPIKGYVQAGQFGEANELSLGDEDVLLYASPKFNNAHGLIVKGDSMNLRYKEGTKLICVPIMDYEKEIESGKAVIVEAICQADEKEITVKEFYTDENGIHWLLPKSTNPTYQNYPVPNGQDLDIVINGRKIKEINIKAIVVSSQYDEE